MAEIGSESEAAKQGELRGVLPAGTRLRSYELVSVLGQGAFGITYRARDTTLNRDVAIKEYLPTSLALREGGTTVLPRSTELAEEFVWGRERFLDEARTLVKLEDVPAVVRVIDFLEANGTAYMVMALARGETLDQRIRREGPLPPPGVERMLYPLLDGLEQVHDVGFLHRDIKPANIILDARGNPTLIDFGAARAAMAGRSTAMTAIFTPGYAAAEQFTSAKQGPWTDIYGLSATLYHAITGRTPPSAFDRMLDDTYKPLVGLSPEGFAPGLLVGIDAGLAVRGAGRPQSIADWRTVLSTTDMPGDQATVALPRPKGPEKARVTATAAVLAGRKRLGLWAAAAVAVVVLAGGAYYALAPKSSSSLVDPQALKAEDLERLLTERRAADAAAAEKKKLEEEAQRQADADAKAKEAADADLAKAREQRQKAEAELAKLKADMEARRQAEAAQRDQAATAARRALEEAEQRNKAEAELAALRKADEEAKQQAAAAAAIRQQADEAAQRKAEAEAAALRQAEEEAAKKAVAEAEAKRQADEVLARAQAERKRADEEAARQKAELETRQKADAEAKAKVEADAKQKAEAAAKQKAEAETKAKAEAEAAAEKKAAETAENALRLATVDRQRLQVALTSLGFDTRGTDGTFGPRSREMIAAWQQKNGAPATGFVSATQRDQLLRSAAAAVGKYDEEQKKLEDDKKKAEEEKKKADEARLKAEEEAKAKAAQPQSPGAAVPSAPSPATPGSAPSSGGYDGTYTGAFGPSMWSPSVRPVTVKVAGSSGSGTTHQNICGTSQFSVTVSGTGDVSGDAQLPFNAQCKAEPMKIQGRITGRELQISFGGARIVLMRSGN